MQIAGLQYLFNMVSKSFIDVEIVNVFSGRQVENAFSL